MIFLGFFTRSVPAPTMHIHQGGTLNTYCGEALTLQTNVSWEQAEQSTCIGCLNAFFPAQHAAREHSEREAAYHGSNQWGR
jgi:hypothetical protein